MVVWDEAPAVSELCRRCMREFVLYTRFCKPWRDCPPWRTCGRGPNRPVVKKGKIMFSLSSVILFRKRGVDSCVFLIFTTRVDPNKRTSIEGTDRKKSAGGPGIARPAPKNRPNSKCLRISGTGPRDLQREGQALLVRPQKIAQIRLVALQVGEAKSIDFKVRTSYSDPPNRL